MLEVKDLLVHYDGAMALNRVNLKVEDGEYVGVVGPNGSGKTTLLRSISGRPATRASGSNSSTQTGSTTNAGTPAHCAISLATGAARFEA